MKNILTIGHNDIRVFLRDRTALIWLLLMPLIFVFVMSFAAPAPGEPANPRPALQITNLDESFLGELFLTELGEQGLRLVTEGDADEADRALTLPADFTARVLSHEEVKLSFLTLEGSSDQSAMLAEVGVLRAVIAINTALVEHAMRHPGDPVTADSLQALDAIPDPVRLDASFAGRKPRPVGYSHSLPSVLVMYLLINLMIFGGSTVATERRQGVLRRLSMHAITRFEMVMGKVYGLQLLAAVQIVFFLLIGRLFLGVNIGDNTFGIALTLFVFSWVAASLGLLLGFFIAAEEKIVGVALLFGLPTAALGGCWWPLEIVPEWMQNAALAVPTAWAMKALHQLITFGSGIGGAAPAIGVLILFALAANTAAMRFLRTG